MQKSKLIKMAGVLYGILVAGILIGLIVILKREESRPDTIDLSPDDQATVEDLADHYKGQYTVAIQLLDDPDHPSGNEKQEKQQQKKALPAWQKNAQTPVITNWPKIAIIIDDLGLSEHATYEIAEMTGPFTLSFLPYAENLPKQTNIAHRAGHELMVHMPMEPKAEEDPGPNALLTTLPKEEFERRVNWNLTRFQDFVGVNNHMGSLMTEKASPMVRFMVLLHRDGLLFVDSLTSPNSVGARAALATGVPFLKRDVFLDNDKDAAAIMRQFAQTERIARKRGYAIAIGHPYPETIKALAVWQATLKSKKIALVPLSQLVSEHEAAKRASAAAKAKAKASGTSAP